MFSGWVGDDDPTFSGLESALKSYLQSAWAGECCLGGSAVAKLAKQAMPTLALILVVIGREREHWGVARSCSCAGQE